MPTTDTNSTCDACHQTTGLLRATGQHKDDLRWLCPNCHPHASINTTPLGGLFAAVPDESVFGDEDNEGPGRQPFTLETYDQLRYLAAKPSKRYVNASEAAVAAEEMSREWAGKTRVRFVNVMVGAGDEGLTPEETYLAFSDNTTRNQEREYRYLQQWGFIVFVGTRDNTKGTCPCGVWRIVRIGEEVKPQPSKLQIARKVIVEQSVVIGELKLQLDLSRTTIAERDARLDELECELESRPGVSAGG